MGTLERPALNAQAGYASLYLAWVYEARLWLAKGATTCVASASGHIVLSAVLVVVSQFMAPHLISFGLNSPVRRNIAALFTPSYPSHMTEHCTLIGPYCTAQKEKRVYSKFCTNLSHFPNGVWILWDCTICSLCVYMHLSMGTYMLGPYASVLVSLLCVVWEELVHLQEFASLPLADRSQGGGVSHTVPRVLQQFILFM